MTALFALLGTAGLGAAILVIVIVARLTHRWEQVTGRPSGFRWFYAAAGLLGLAALLRLVRVVHMEPGAAAGPLSDPGSWLYLCLYHAPLFAGTAIALVVAWRNWGWLLGAQGR
ncbi:MAG: hypothetical protein JXA09_04585 [Anaerolineae bacterium]|nr:hypothetical protein [Anaerolineae bacterium]